MKGLAALGNGFPLSSRCGHAGTRAAVVLRPIAFKTCTFCMVIFSTAYFVTISADANFSVPSTGYNCESNMICLNHAHVYNGTGSTSNIKAGRLSLILEDLPSQDVGIAYYNQPIRLRDPSTAQAASFNTSFAIDIVMDEVDGSHGDGVAFVISGDNDTVGSYGRYLGIFSPEQTTRSKSIVVEFDGFLNDLGGAATDINDNHLSFDFGNMSFVAAEDASNVSVYVWSNRSTIYAWVEYSQESQQLEARVSNNNSRPVSPLISYKVDLFSYVDEYMWVGFSASNGDDYSNYYIGAWTFVSYGISASSPASSGNKVGPIIVGVSVGIPAALILACIFILIFVRRRSFRKTGYTRRGSFQQSDDSIIQLDGMPERFSYKELSESTNSFSKESKLGHGGFGTVHRGVLPSSGIHVAVKKINSESNQGEREFMAEVSIISRLSHRNLIQLMGWCKDSSKGYLLVYELMINGSLDKVLFGATGKEMASLSWETRCNIVMGTARGLDYLHEGWKQQVLHRDIKSSNIMLDENWNPKLGDFGLARLVDHEKAAATTMVAGTYGYIAPEVANSGKFTDKSDVYAFGAVVLEVACGRQALERDAPPEELMLVDWVWKSLSEGHLLSTVDKRLSDYDKKGMELLLIVGLLCSHPNPLARPSMRQVVQVLAGEAPVPSIPASKPGIIFSSDSREILLHPSDWYSKASISTSSKSISLVSTNFSERTGASIENSNSAENFAHLEKSRYANSFVSVF